MKVCKDCRNRGARKEECAVSGEHICKADTICKEKRFHVRRKDTCEKFERR